MVPEQTMTGTVIGGMLGIPGAGHPITFGILHVFAFRDDLVRREQLWIDSGSLVAQLTAA
jgi:predicted ester cyclase